MSGSSGSAAPTIDLSFGALADAQHIEREPGDRERHLNQVWSMSE